MLRWYNRTLSQRPILTQAVTTAMLFAAGDIVAQQAVEKKGREHVWARTGRMFAYGAVIFGPSAATWFRIVSTHVSIPKKYPRHAGLTLLARVSCDQLIFAPTFMAIFLYSMAILEGSSPAEKLNHSYFAALKMNYLIWPAVQLVNFRFVPLQHRLMFVNVIAIGWNSYLSWLNAKGAKKEYQQQETRNDGEEDEDERGKMGEMEEQPIRRGGKEDWVQRDWEGER